MLMKIILADVLVMSPVLSLSFADLNCMKLLQVLRTGNYNIFATFSVLFQIYDTI